ncbi:Uncharacterized membrane protein YgdD, TMEM256/DUF423 family [Cohnella sp. OV330]|uniref:DUF423 domain-containing protein n=1 Tax=Cohnella sp. OV330 TaxID=1855288 RepID=UPI0008ED6E0C|nr:DUF423 domain-containing protein [Cohnella sp. OV330]SFB39505.1 Uncharacterized membrane protein YgdD, TMEM256/DUF423 family [Cohnella sp. OV330]
MLLKKYVGIGAIVAGLAVAFGAFGAHSLKETLSEHYLEVFETGVRYQMYHGLGILLVALLSERLPSALKLLRWSARLLLIGTVLFSGSLYILALSGIDWLGAITPLGGVAFLAGWACLAVAAFKGGRGAA